MELTNPLTTSPNETEAPFVQGIVEKPIWYRAFAVVYVSVYLAGTFCYLRLTKKVIPPTSLWKIFIAYVSPLSSGALETINSETGFCFTASVPEKLLSDKGGRSRIHLFENNKELPHPHASHDQVRNIGNGAYSHWGNTIYFSSSDNSDPRTNGRKYHFKEKR